MSVILEFAIDESEFALGRALSGASDVRFELERIVPMGSEVVPFVWASGGDLATFEASVGDRPEIDEICALDSVGDRGLYRIEWAGGPLDLGAAIEVTDATVLEANGDGVWGFRVRFPDHDALSAFHEYCTDYGLTIRVRRTYTPTEATELGRQFDLSTEQREALVMALRHGYFATPSEASLDELAEEFGISRQALSNRIRRGNETVLRQALLASASER